MRWPGRRARAWAADYRYVLWRQLESVLARGPSDDSRGRADLPPIVMVPGVYESWVFMGPLAAELSARGHEVYFVKELAYHGMDIPSAAEAVQAVIRGNDLTDVVIVGHSKGGLVGKYLLAHLPAGARVRRLIAVATPFSGSWYALLWILPSVRVFAPTSRLIRGLRREERVNGRIVSVYASFDPHIPGGSRLEGAVNIKVPAMGHFRILEDPEVIAAVAEWAEKDDTIGI